MPMQKYMQRSYCQTAGADPNPQPVSPLIKLVVRPLVDCHYLLPGPRLSFQLQSSTALCRVPHHIASGTHVKNLPRFITQKWNDEGRTATFQLQVPHPNHYTAMLRERQKSILFSNFITKYLILKHEHVLVFQQIIQGS